MIRFYVITDPCYLLTADEWTASCRHLESDFKNHSDTTKFHKSIEEYLTRMSGSKSFSTDTGYGDWANEIRGNSEPIYKHFTADTGCVCVVEYTKFVRNRVDEDDLLNKGLAGLIAVDDEPKVEFDRSVPNWTVVRITDGINNYKTME